MTRGERCSVESVHVLLNDGRVLARLSSFDWPASHFGLVRLAIGNAIHILRQVATGNVAGGLTLELEPLAGESAEAVQRSMESQAGPAWIERIDDAP